MDIANMFPFLAIFRIEFLLFYPKKQILDLFSFVL